MTLTQAFSCRRCAAVGGAEFRKVWASRIPLVMLLAIPIGTYLFVFEMYHVEGNNAHVGNAFDALPQLFFAVWKSMLLQAAMVAFAAFWTTLDSQYGMIRVACCQPLTRSEYLIGKWAGIGLHVVAFVLMFVASLLAWTGIYSGFHGAGLQDVVSVGRFTVELVAFVVALASIVMAVASVRRTVGSGIVLGLFTVILLAFMTMVPSDVLPERFVFIRYYFFPVGELRIPTGGDARFYRQLSSVADFYRTISVTAFMFVLPALLYFGRRDIVE